MNNKKILNENIGGTILSNIVNLNALTVTVLIESILWVISTTITYLMLRNSKVDKNLTQKLSKIVDQPTVVQILHTKIVNAFCTEDRNVYITTGMIKQLQLSEKEQISILLHEVGHANQKKIFFLLSTSSRIENYLSISILSSLFQATHMDIRTTVCLYFVFRTLFSIFGSNLISKYYEYNADSFAVKYGYGEYLVSSFRKLIKYIKKEGVKDKSGNVVLNPDNNMLTKCLVFFQDLLSTHPNTYKRIKKMIKNDVNNFKDTNITTRVKNMMKKSGHKINLNSLSQAVLHVKKILFKGVYEL